MNHASNRSASARWRPSAADLVRRGAPVVVGALLTSGVLVTAPTVGAGTTALPALPVAAQADVTATPDVQMGVVPASTTQFFLSRDPFDPIRPPETSSDGGTDAAVGDGLVATPVVAPPPGDGTAVPQPDPGCVQAASVVCDGDVVALMDVTDGSAVISVGSVVHTVAPGATFADVYRVVTIDGACVTLLHGDDTFTLCEGEQVLK